MLDVTNSGNGCSWVNNSTSISATMINDAINSNGGSVLIQGRITDSCPGGVGCSGFSDPCFNATLSYDYAPSSNFSANFTETCIGGGVVFTNETTGPQDTYDWDFGADAVPATATGPGPHSVQWTTTGDKDISLTVEGNGDSSTETKVAYIEVGVAPASIIFGDAFEIWQNPTNGAVISTSKSVLDANDDLIICGTASNADIDVWLKKVAPNGSTIWEMSYPNVGTEGVNDLVLDDAGNVYLCGVSGSDYLIMKVNADGSLAWMESYDADSGSDIAKAICLDDAGNIYVTGRASGSNGGDVTTVKYTNAGSYVLHITEVDMGFAEGADIEYHDGHIYVFGTENEGGLNNDWLLVKYETQLGIEEWIRHINGTGFANDFGYQMVLQNDSLYLAGSMAQSGGEGWTLARYDLEGNEDWIEDQGADVDGYGDFEAMAVGPNGYLYLGITSDMNGPEEVYVQQINKSNGVGGWSSDFSGINDTHFRGLHTASDGSVFIACETWNNASNFDLAIVQMAENGTEMWWGVYDGCGNGSEQVKGLCVSSNDEAIVYGHNQQALANAYGLLTEPIASFTVDPTPVCLGDTVTFTSTSEGSALTFNWDFGANAAPASAMGPGPHQVVYGATGISTVSLAVSNSLGMSDVSHDVEILSLPAISTSGDEDLCLGNSTEIEAMGTGTISWNNGLGQGSTHTVLPTENTTYVATIMDANGCSSADSLTITVLPLPLADAGADQEICPGDTTTISASGGTGYDWDNGLGSGQSHEVSPTTTTVFEVTVSDDNNCEATDQVEVAVLPDVQLSIDGLTTDPYCVEDDGAYGLTGSPAGGTFSGPGVAGGMFTPGNAGVGVHDIVYTYTDGNNCVHSTTVIVEVEVCSGVEEYGVDFRLFPNPTTGNLFIEATGSNLAEEVEVSDALGQHVSIELLRTERGFTMDLTGLAKGLYLVKVRAENVERVYSVMLK